MALASSVALFSLLAVGASAQEATGTFPATALAEKTFAYDQIPYRVDTDTQLIRGQQSGYNQCNSTNAGQESKCQTSFLNSLADFCLWAPMEPDIIANTEGEEVAWCTTDHHARLIPEGTITGLELIETPEYRQLTGFIKGANINIKDGDFGGELDPHGADLRGNPLGGLMYSTAFSGNIDQVFEWHLFISNTGFCFRVCDPSSSNDASFCQHIYDRIGCSYNDPSSAQDGEFVTCKGDVGLPPGIYVENGQTMTYTQPPESLGAISTMPYTATVPPKSECTTYQSTELFSALATVVPSGSQAASASHATGTSSGTRGAHGASVTGASGSASPSASGSAGDSDGAFVNVAIGGASILSVVLSALFLA